MPPPAATPPAGVVRFYRYDSGGASFREEVLAGLARAPKCLPAEHRADETGVRILAAIRALDKYFPASAGLALMNANAQSIAAFLGPETELIGFGAGDAAPTRVLLESLQPSLYIPVDLDEPELRASVERVAVNFPRLNVCALAGDFTRPIVLPEFIGVPVRRRAVYCADAILGEREPDAARALLENTRDLLRPGGILLGGVALKKDPDAMRTAYDDAGGLAAKYNFNLLERINRELNGDFRADRFRYTVTCDAGGGCIEMHLESMDTQTVHVAGQTFSFDAGEPVRTAVACAYEIEEFRALAASAGFHPLDVWTDARGNFALHALLAL